MFSNLVKYSFWSSYFWKNLSSNSRWCWTIFNLFEASLIISLLFGNFWILQYPKGLKSSFSKSIIKDIINKNIKYYCSSELGSSGGPILSLSNFKIIGIHKRKTRFEYNETWYEYESK